MSSVSSIKSLFEGLGQTRVWWMLAKLSLASRFRRSYLGVAWLFIGFIVFSVSTGLVWAKIMKQDPLYLISFIGVGFAVWGFIVAAMTEGTAALVNSAGYMKQMNLPYSVYFMRNVAVSSVVCLNGIVAALLIRVLMGGWFSPMALLAIPGFALLVVCGIAVTVIMGYVGTRFRDLNHGLSSVMNLLFVVTPIIYPPELLRQRGGELLVDLNPFFAFIEIVRRPIVNGEPASANSYTVAGVVTCAAIVGAILAHQHFARRAVYYV